MMLKNSFEDCRYALLWKELVLEHPGEKGNFTCRQRGGTMLG